MSKMFNRFTIACVFLLAFTVHTGLLLADQITPSESAEVQPVESELAGTQLAMNDADALASKGRDKSVAESGPVLLVPMVLAVLALVAVSRRKES